MLRPNKRQQQKHREEEREPETVEEEQEPTAGFKLRIIEASELPPDQESKKRQIIGGGVIPKESWLAQFHPSAGMAGLKVRQHAVNSPEQQND